MTNFASGESDAASAHRAIPEGGEQDGALAAAEAIGTLPAHADGPGGGGHAAGTGEDFEKGELAPGSPAVEAGFAVLHRPVWSTNAGL